MRGPELNLLEQIVEAVDDPSLPVSEWTVDGRELAPVDRQVLADATMGDWRALHDLFVLSAAAGGRPRPCPPGCPWCEPELAG